MTAIHRSTFAVLVLLLLLSLFWNVAYAKEKPEIVRLDAEYTEMLVKISVHWQSSNPVTFIRAIVGKEMKELKVDEYDNRRNPDGYSGEAVIVVNAAPTAGMDGIPYVVQIEDDLRQKSEQVTGSAKTPTGLAGTGAVTYPGAAGTGAGTWSASGAWSAAGTVPPPAGSWPAAGTGQGGGGFPASGTAQGGAWSGGGFPASGAAQGGAWPAGGAYGQGSGGWPQGGSGVSYGGSPSIGDALSKAQQGRPGELIDKTIGFVSGSGTGAGGPAGAMGAPPPPAGAMMGAPPPPAGAMGASPTPAGAGTPQTLQNEKFGTGGKASFVSILKPGDEVAVVLGPVDQPFRVTKIFFLFGGSSGKGIVTLKVYQDVGTADDGGVLFTASFEVQGSDAAFQEVDLAQVGGVVAVPGGNVRVSIQVQHAGLPSLGFDTSANAIPGRNWINRSGVWSDIGTAGIRGNGIIRATVAP